MIRRIEEMLTSKVNEMVDEGKKESAEIEIDATTMKKIQKLDSDMGVIVASVLNNQMTRKKLADAGLIDVATARKWVNAFKRIKVMPVDL